MRAAKDTADEFVTSKGGMRLATSIGGTLTGRGGSLIIIDDPLSAEGGSSEADRERANDFYRSTVVTRLDNKASGVIILVMQRLHEEDLFGTIKREGVYTELVLPAIAPCEQKIQIGPDRWKTRAEGDVLDIKREPLHVLEALRRTKGSAQFQAQYQQAPVPAGGNMIKREWLKTFDISSLPHQAGDQVVQSWDTAMKGGEHNDYSVCTTWKLCNGFSYLLDVRRQQCDFPTLQRLAKEEYLRHQPDVVLIEDKGSGTSPDPGSVAGQSNNVYFDPARRRQNHSPISGLAADRGGNSLDSQRGTMARRVPGGAPALSPSEVRRSGR